MGTEPLVSIVTPFYNTGDFIEECIESVLAQTYQNYEYLLVNNKSTDDGPKIAARYAERDPRIRLIHNDVFVGQAENYNGALARIDPASKYVKMVLADDVIFPTCVQSMVSIAERDPNVGLVSSYHLNGIELWGSGVPYPASVMSGRAVVRFMLSTKRFLLGTPSVVLYRADIVRSRRPFFVPGRYHIDTEAGYEILLEHDFGFVHQIQSFVRTQEGSLTSEKDTYHAGKLDYLMVLERYGREVLSSEEFETLSSEYWNFYLNFMGNSLPQRRGRAFWDYHRGGLATIGRDLPMRQLLPRMLVGMARLAFNPLTTIERGLASRHRGGDQATIAASATADLIASTRHTDAGSDPLQPR